MVFELIYINIIEDWYGSLNEVLINDQDPVSTNDTVDESIGNTSNTNTSKIFSLIIFSFK